jgi:phosphate transport system substrate-binding protein
VSGDRGALGYFGFSYFEENQDKLKALEVDGGDGCVAPSVETAQDDSYTPLSRPLFMYVKVSSLQDNESVEEFLRFALENQQTIAEGRSTFRSARSRSTSNSRSWTTRPRK